MKPDAVAGEQAEAQPVGQGTRALAESSTVARMDRPPRWLRADWLFLGAVLLLALGLRLYQYTEAPRFHDNPDEVQFAWAGLSLLTQHAPQTWSYFPEYGHYTWLVTPDGYSYPLVQPWLDHPPLFPLVTGAAAWLAGERSFVDVTPAPIRIPVIWLSLIAVALMYALGRRLLGQRPAMIATVLFATAPGAVLFSRSVETEALLAPLLLAALLAVHRLLTGDGRRGSIALLVVCCVLAPLVKVPGVAVGGIAAIVLLAERRWRLALIAVGAAALGLAGFALYGLWQNWTLFVAVFQEQAAHRSGVMGAFEFIIEPAGLNRRFSDPWWLLGWIGVGALLATRVARRASLNLVAWPIVAYAAAMLVMADVRVAYFGWYRIAIYPLVYLAAGYLVWRVLTAPSPAGVGLLLITGGAAAAAAWFGGPTTLKIATGTLVAVLLAVILGSLAILRSNRRAARAITAAVLVLIGLGNIIVSLQLSRLYLQI